tara:strand:+ start:240 stop:452 length:213 start_codon:yes stop_codon:yes gene_type:complete
VHCKPTQITGAPEIELQMAHVTQNIVRSTYNKAELMPARTKMMQEWADHLDALKVNPSVQSNISIPDTAS